MTWASNPSSSFLQLLQLSSALALLFVSALQLLSPPSSAFALLFVSSQQLLSPPSFASFLLVASALPALVVFIDKDFALVVPRETLQNLEF